jgi:hypothetical protein
MTWAWLYLVLGTLLQRFELDLHDTTERNVEMTRDCFIGQTDPGLNNVRVKVLREYQYLAHATPHRQWHRQNLGTQEASTILSRRGINWNR